MPSTLLKVAIGGCLAGFGLLMSGLVGLFVAPIIIRDQVAKRDVIGFDTLSDGTRVLNDMTKKFLHPPFEMIMHVWMFSVQNEAAFLAGREKIRLSQKGPYAFVEDQEKVVHEFSPAEDRIFYRNRRRYFFSRNHSCIDCSLADTATIPNVLFQKLVDFADVNEATKLAIESLLFALRRETPFVTVKVGEALFDGYFDSLLSRVCAVPVLAWICQVIKIPDRIGFFYGQNNTDDGLYEVGTGKCGTSELGKMYSLNNSTSLPSYFWDSPTARTINGTDGQVFPLFPKKDAILSPFAWQTCRFIKLAYAGESDYEGVRTWRYTSPASTYDPSLPENRAYCHLKSTVQYFDNSSVQIPGCLPSGMIDISKCQPGEPRVYLSQPHFLLSPKEVWSAVGGLDEPSVERDTTFVDFEPTSGVPVHAKRLMQVNVGMRRGNLRSLARTKNVIVPVFWVNETAKVDEETRYQMANQLQLAQRLSFIAGALAILFGVLLIVGVVVSIMIYEFQYVIFDFVTGIPREDTTVIVREAVENSNTNVS